MDGDLAILALNRLDDLLLILQEETILFANTGFLEKASINTIKDHFTNWKDFCRIGSSVVESNQKTEASVNLNFNEGMLTFWKVTFEPLPKKKLLCIFKK